MTLPGFHAEHAVYRSTVLYRTSRISIQLDSRPVAVHRSVQPAQSSASPPSIPLPGPKLCPPGQDPCGFTGSPPHVADYCCQPGEKCCWANAHLCCPPDQTCCVSIDEWGVEVGQCCPSDARCTYIDGCCPNDKVDCNDQCCGPGEVCTSDGCCPSTSACGDLCCDEASTVCSLDGCCGQNGVYVAPDGLHCCPRLQIATDVGCCPLGTCCNSDNDCPDNMYCCGQVCCPDSQSQCLNLGSLGWSCGTPPP